MGYLEPEELLPAQADAVEYGDVVNLDFGMQLDVIAEVFIQDDTESNEELTDTTEEQKDEFEDLDCEEILSEDETISNETSSGNSS